MKKILLLLLALSVFLPVYAQQDDIKRCATSEYTEYLIRQNPEVLTNMQKIERDIQNFISHQGEKRSSQTVIVIPVVVHVIWNTSAQNISEQMVTSQIRVLNEDYRKMFGTNGWNTNPVGADVKIEFRIADRDPNGLPHSGINRVYTTRTSFNYQTDNTYLKGLSYWPSDKYLNLWTANLSGGVLGYAQFPGGPATTDGVVILYSAFGYASPFAPYNLGRTTTHEVGHWVNLIHIWGDVTTCTGTDYCDDTPPCSGQYFSGYPTCPIPTQCSYPRMIQNYMDYSDDGCMNIFTVDQTSRMRAAYNVYRYNLLVSLKERIKVTQTGIDYNFTDTFGETFAPLNFSTLPTGNDTITVEVFPNLPPLNIPSGTKVVKRYFNISTSGTGFSANMKLRYNDAEVVGFTNGDNNLKLYKWTTNGWTNMGGTVNTTSNYVALDNVTSFSTWTMADPNDNPIPVELTAFAADVNGNSVDLNWTTATEINSSAFFIERAISSNDYRDVKWTDVKMVRGAGNSTEPRHYSYTDENLKPGSYLYRLRMEDNDGSIKYSEMVSVNVETPKTYVLEQNYPNPFNPATTITYSLPEASFVTIKIYDALGKEAAVLFRGDKEAGSYEINFDASNLPSGIYYYTMIANGFTKTNKMMLLK